MTGQRTGWNTKRPRLLLLTLGFCLLALLSSGAWGQTAQAVAAREYQIKAAFVYNFMKFVAGGRLGPADDKGAVNADPNRVLQVGIVGQLPSKDSFAELQGKTVTDKRIQVRYFKGFGDLKEAEQQIPKQHPQMDQIRQCHVLFLCPSEKLFLARILPPLQKEGILLVGDTSGFLEAGGTINLLIEDKKVRFEINLAAAGRAKLQMRSSLLRLAVRTVEHDSLERQNAPSK